MRSGPAQALVGIARGMRFELQQLTTSRLYLITAVVIPLIFASLAHYMFQNSGRHSDPLGIALSAGLMGMWSTTLLGSGNAINRLRLMKVLEPLVGSPTSTFVFALPFSLATATMGLYSMTATLAWSGIVFDVPLIIAEPGLFALAVVVTMLALGVLGLLLASAFILYPTANSLANLFQYPIWLLSGVLVPITALPGPAQAVSRALAPSWGVESVLGAASGHPGALRAIGFCALISVGYAGIALLLLRRFEWLARSSGTLALQ